MNIHIISDNWFNKWKKESETEKEILGFIDKRMIFIKFPVFIYKIKDNDEFLLKNICRYEVVFRNESQPRYV
jgi:hypothetical protein